MGSADRRALGLRRDAAGATSALNRLMLLLDGEAISAVAQGSRSRRDRVRALIAEMRVRNRPVATVAAVLK